MFEISPRKFFWLKKLKTLVTSDLKGEEIVGRFYEKELQKTNQKEFRVEKVIKRKGHKLYVKWKVYNNSLTVGLIKKTYNKWVNIFKNQNLLKKEWKLN